MRDVGLVDEFDSPSKPGNKIMWKHLEARPGIYQIRNTKNGKRYIGKSNDIIRRLTRHKSQLKCKNHYNEHLQRSWDRNGAENFIFEVVEYCETTLLPIKEQHWIDATEPELLYNGDLFVVDKHHDHNPFFGKTHSQATKLKMSDAKEGMYLGEDNPNFGNRWDETQKDRMRGDKNVNAKLDEEKVREIKRMLSEGIKHQVIANQFDINRTVVTRINSGARWAHLKE